MTGSAQHPLLTSSDPGETTSEAASTEPPTWGSPVGDKRWTLGNSQELAPGAEHEPAWVSLGWIIVPTLLALALVAWMARIA